MAQLNDLVVSGNSRFIARASASGPLNQILIGTGTAGTSSGSTYYPAKWTFTAGATPNIGDVVNIKIPVAGHDYGVFMSIDGGTTYHPIVRNDSNRLTSHYGVNMYLSVIFDPDGSATNMFPLNGGSSRVTVTGGVWRIINFYDTGNDTAYYIRRGYNRLVAGSNKIFPYTFIMQLPDGRWESIVTSSSTATSKTRNPHGFLLGQLLLMYQNKTYNENAHIDDSQVWDYRSYDIDHRYSFNTANDSTNGTTAWKPIYLVGSLGNDGLFYLDTTWWTQTLPSTADGKLYIYIGDAIDYYRMDFVLPRPIYHYVNGALREFAQDAGSVNGFTVEKSVPSNAVFTDNNTTYSMTRDGESVKLTPSSGSAQSVSLSSLINGLGEGSSPAQQDDYLVAQYAGGGTTTTSYHRRAVKNIVNAANVKTALGTGSGTTKYLREDGTWQTPPSGSDVNVTQTATSTSADYEVLFSATADNTTRTETARKNSNLKFNPSSGNLQATQLNGVTIGSSPKFTDNNTTYTFANGTNGFTVTPSGGSAQTVTVTPSITNNVTGSGTSGYLAKFNGANTITNGVALGSDTTKFLRNDGTWQTPSARQVYFDTPTVPYSVGDLWLGNGNVWYCTVAKASGEDYDESDWDATVDYAEYANALIDDTVDYITGNNGGKVIVHLDEDKKPYEMLFTDGTSKIWKFDGTGFKFSSDNGQSFSPITNTNGQLDATFITSGVLDASKVTITNFSTSSITAGDLYRGGTDNNLGTVVIKNQQNVVIGEINKLGLKMYGPGDVGSRPYIVINDTDFFAGYSANGTMIFKVVGNVVNMVNASVTSSLLVGNKEGYKINFVPITITENGVIVNDGIAIV